MTINTNTPSSRDTFQLYTRRPVPNQDEIEKVLPVGSFQSYVQYSEKLRQRKKRFIPMIVDGFKHSGGGCMYARNDKNWQYLSIVCNY